MVKRFTEEFHSSEQFAHVRPPAHPSPITRLTGDELRDAIRNTSYVVQRALIVPSGAALLENLGIYASGGLNSLGARIGLKDSEEILQKATGFLAHEHRGSVLELPHAAPLPDLSSERARQQAAEALGKIYSEQELQDFARRLGAIATTTQPSVE